MINATPRPLYPRGEDPRTTVQKIGWAPAPVWTDAPPGFDPRTAQPVASLNTDYAIPAHNFVLPYVNDQNVNFFYILITSSHTPETQLLKAKSLCSLNFFFVFS